jgi:hypothetical protein
MTGDDFRGIALQLDGVVEKAHMNHPDFRTGGRIFASLLPDGQRAGLNLSPEEQRELMKQHPAVFAPAPGAWGRQGWTTLNLPAADAATARSAILLAYERVSAKSAVGRARRTRAAKGRRPASRRR